MNENISNEIIENRTIYPIMDVEGKRMTITATEFKKNLGKYLELVATEEIVITKNGKTIAVLSKPVDKIAILRSLIGIAKPDDGSEVDLNQIRDERLKKQ